MQCKGTICGILKQGFVHFKSKLLEIAKTPSSIIQNITSAAKLENVICNSDFIANEQQRRRPACASAQSGQRLCYSLYNSQICNFIHFQYSSYMYYSHCSLACIIVNLKGMFYRDDESHMGQVRPFLQFLVTLL